MVEELVKEEVIFTMRSNGKGMCKSHVHSFIHASNPENLLSARHGGKCWSRTLEQNSNLWSGAGGNQLTSKYRSNLILINVSHRSTIYTEYIK